MAWTAPAANSAVSMQRTTSLALMPDRALPQSARARFRTGLCEQSAGQSVGRGARRWARCSGSSSSTSSSMGLPGAHIMATTNRVRASAGAVPSW